jgi:hypothetical protein
VPFTSGIRNAGRGRTPRLVPLEPESGARRPYGLINSKPLITAFFPGPESDFNLHFEHLLTTLKLPRANILRPAVDHLLPQIAQDLDTNATTGSTTLHGGGRFGVEPSPSANYRPALFPLFND